MHIYTKLQFQSVHRLSESHQQAFQDLEATKNPGLEDLTAFPKEKSEYSIPLNSKL